MVRLCPVLLLALVLAGCGGGDGGGEAPSEGDPARGKEVFAASGCGACHTFAAAGSERNVGPNLDEVAKEYDAEFIRESIVDPKAYIEKGEAGSIGGEAEYKTTMPAYGPDEMFPQKLTEDQLADLVAFLTS